MPNYPPSGEPGRDYYRRRGLEMKEGLRVAERGNAEDASKRRLQAVTPPDTPDMSGAQAASEGRSDATKSERLTLVVDQLPHAAYMVNHKFEVTWFNEQARLEIPGLLNDLPPHTDDRSVFRLLLDNRNDAVEENTLSMLRLNLTLAKERMSLSAILQPLRGISGSRAQLLEQMYEDAEAARSNVVIELPMVLTAQNRAQDYAAYATSFREGILVVVAPRGQDSDELKELLSRRDVVIRTLLSQRLPMLTDLVVLVADLQESVKICSELPPDEYFELINKIWSTAGDIFRSYYGTYGKHVGDGMVYYFFPQPDSNYIFNAAVCAMELKSAMGRLSKEWQLRKNWTNELYLNTGLNEGQEWLGTFHTATSIEFVVLGETINHTARLSDMARFGQVWATKNFMSKLPPEYRDRVEFGIERVGANGQRMLVQSSYSRVGNLVDVDTGRYVKLQDIAGLAVTEIRNIK